MSKVPRTLRPPSRALGLLLVGVLLLASASVYAWGRNEQEARQSSPETFWEALETSLTASAVTCRIIDKQDGRSSDQAITLDLQSQYRATTGTTIRQDGTVVTTEGINTKTHEYIRYTTIRTSQRGPDGKRLDFSKVVHVWGKRPADAGKGMSLYGQTAFGGCIVPLAGLSDEQAERRMWELKKGKVFETDAAKVAWAQHEGQQLRSFDVTVQPEPYITLMKQLANDRGLKELETVAAEEYASKQPERLTFLVDAGSRQLRAIKYTAQDRTVQFSDYGIAPDIDEPDHTIPADELQERLQAVR